MKVKTAIEPGIKSRFGIMDFSTSNAIWGLCFVFSLTVLNLNFEKFFLDEMDSFKACSTFIY